MIIDNISELIGNTPLVPIKHLNPNPKVKIFAKLEGENPTGSLKDRIVKFMIEGAEASGELTKDRIILEPTSGNTGISLALVSRIKGYRLKVVMPESVSIERREILSAFGAEFVLTPGDEGTNGAIRVAEQMAGEDATYFMPNQYANINNPRAHYETTAVEILNDLNHVDAFVAGLGTGGTLMGVGKRLREANPNVRITAVQPYPQGGLQGLRNLSEGYVPPILDLGKIDESFLCKDEDAFLMVQRLAMEEAIFSGISCGAVMHWAAKVAEKMDGGTLVVLFPDGGWKYLSEHLWTTDTQSLSKQITGPLW